MLPHLYQKTQHNMEQATKSGNQSTEPGQISLVPVPLQRDER